MDYEKKYKEALADAKFYYEELDSDTTKNVLEEIFPELQEEESERIRKELLNFLHQLDIQGYTDWRYNSWVAWLEKQGELVEDYEDRLDRCACEYFNKGYKAAIEHKKEKPADKVEPKFHEGE